MQAIRLPENVKPAFEWINGRAVQKVSPKRRHSLAQGRFVEALSSWARATGSGMVGPEWRFEIQPAGEKRTALVPDVAFLSYHTMPYEEQLGTEVPRVAPDVVVEILSPGDKRSELLEKIRVYLKAGTSVVFVVDPSKRSVAAHSAAGIEVLGEADHLTHPALPGFRIQVVDLFTPPAPKTHRRTSRT